MTRRARRLSNRRTSFPGVLVEQAYELRGPYFFAEEAADRQLTGATPVVPLDRAHQFVVAHLGIVQLGLGIQAVPLQPSLAIVGRICHLCMGYRSAVEGWRLLICERFIGCGRAKV
jgi:hypothetical protein